jgi:hypothetical protein
MSWLKNLVNQHKELESPPSFWYWSGLCAISAVMKDQVWMDRQIFKTYLNIYAMLHAESGLKKGPPVAMARNLVRTVPGMQIISGRSSIQGILKEMGGGMTMPGGKIVGKSKVFICSSELSSSIVEDKVATKILTDLYDRQYNIGEWKSLLKMESFELKDPTITMLTATNEAMSEDFFTKSAIQGGYFARTFIIYEKDSQVVNSLIYPLANPPNYTSSAEYLKELSRLQGPFHPIASMEKSDEFKYRKIKQGRDVYFNASGITYDDWYDSFKENIKVQELRDETGTMNRFGDSVLKVAMLLSLAEAPRLYVTEESMTGAITECEKLLGNVRKTTLGKHGLSNTALLKSLIIMELLNRDNHQVSRTVLMKKMWQHYSNSEEFDELLQSFDAAGLIITTSVGNTILYTMPDLQVLELQRFMAGKTQK